MRYSPNRRGDIELDRCLCGWDRRKGRYVANGCKIHPKVPIDYRPEYKVKDGRVTGIRWAVETKIPIGATILTDYGQFTYLGPGVAGMLVVSGADGIEQMIPPSEVKDILTRNPSDL